MIMRKPMLTHLLTLTLAALMLKLRLSDAFTVAASQRKIPLHAPLKLAPRSTTILASSLSKDGDENYARWSVVDSIQVKTLDNWPIKLGDVLSQHLDGAEDTVILSCLSHFGDYNAWEMTQQYISAVKSGRLSDDSPVVLVGIGSVEAAKIFAADIGLSTDPSLKDRIVLVTDETGSVTEALDCYRGWLTVDKKHKERYPFTDVNPAIKLLGMIFGFGSPGTLGKVVEGYTGDIAKNYGLFGRQWVVQALTQGGEKGRFPHVDVSLDTATELQPFELATLRLQTGLHIVAKWGKLGPKDEDLFTRMGGTFVFSNKQCIYEHFDLGILNFANMDDICLAAEAAIKGEKYIPPSNKSLAKKNRQSFWARKDADAKRQIQENMRRVEEARREEQRRAEEAKRAEQARIDELDRIEAERIAEIARQGEEARQARLAEVEAEKDAERLKTEEAAEMTRQAEAVEFTRLAEKESREKAEKLETERKAEEAQQAEKEQAFVLKFESSQSDAARSSTVEDDFEASVDEILMRAEEQEKKIRESLKAIQKVQKASKAKDHLEASQRNLLAARIKYDRDAELMAETVNGASIAEMSQADYVENESTTLPTTQKEHFQRELLAARIKFAKPYAHKKSQPDVTVSMSNSVSEVGATGNGSKNGSANGYYSKNLDHREIFQRNLLASRYKYERSNEAITANGKAETKTPDLVQ